MTHDDLWHAVQQRIVQPPAPRWHRIALRLGTSEEDLVLLGSARDLRLPWAIALGGALSVAIVAGLAPSHAHAVFLLLGPAIPMLAVISAYDATDCLRELTGATPYPKVRLGLLRTAAVLSVALPTMLAVGVAVPVLAPVAWAWLLPALMLTWGALVLLNHLSTRITAGVIAVSWVGMVGVIEAWRGSTALGGVLPQLGSVLIAVLTVGLASLVLSHQQRKAWS